MLISHGLVGLMIFFEVVLGKLFALGVCSSFFSILCLMLTSLLHPPIDPEVRIFFFTLGVASSVGLLVFLTLLLVSALTLAFKVSVYQLQSKGIEPHIPVRACQDGTNWTLTNDIPDHMSLWLLGRDSLECLASQSTHFCLRYGRRGGSCGFRDI
jgi:hypothetical protein